MSRQSEHFSLGEFSAFFNNDQSDGHRLAEFLQKKKGVTTRKRHILVDYDPGPINLNVQVVKANPPNTTNKATLQQNDVVDQDGTATIPENSTKNVEINDENLHYACQEDDAKSLSRSKVSPEQHKKEASNNEHKEPENNEQNMDKNPIQGNLPLSPKPRPSQGRLSAIKHCGSPASPSDRLRRYSLKRLSSVGRRTLLKEFESTINLSSFKPPVCSTPCHSGLNDKPASALNHNVLPTVSQNIISTTTTASNTTDVDSPASSNLNTMENLQRKDDELKEMLKAVHETTQKIYRDRSQSATRRTFNVEKVSETGQIILTPTKESSMMAESQLNDSDTVIPQTGPLSSQIVLARKKYTFEKPSPSHTLTNRSGAHETIVPNTSDRHVSISANVTKHQPEVFVPETQELVEKGQQLLNSTPQNDHVRMVVCVSVPRDNLTSQRTPTTGTAHEPPSTPKSTRVQSAVQLEKSRDGNSIQLPSKENPVIVKTPAKSSSPSSAPLRPASTLGCENVPMGTPVRPPGSTTFVSPYTLRSMEVAVASITPVKTHLTSTQVQNIKEINSADDPNYENIMTDDEDEIENVARHRNSAPLNLASSSGTTRTRKLRKRSTVARRSTRFEKSPITSTETETEMGPPRAHPVIVSRMQQQTHQGHHKRRVLNKAPRTPINGEKFAVELGRLTNHEILDLRKRNSLGRVFPISGRKSQSEKKEALEKRNQLEEKLIIEIHKRHITDDIEEESQNHAKVKENRLYGSSSNTETVKLTPERGISPMSKFVQSIIRRDRDLSPLYGSGSNDRVTFAGAKDQTRNDDTLNDTKKSTRRRRVHAPEVKDYLALVKEVKSRSKSHMDQSTKRLLYTKGQSDCEEQSPELKNSQPRLAYQSKTPQIHAVSSPSSPMSPQREFKIPTPPTRKSRASPLIVTSSSSHTTEFKEGEGALEVIPPPELFTDREQSLRESINIREERGNCKNKRNENNTEGNEFTKPMSSSVNPSPFEDSPISGNDLRSEGGYVEVEKFKKPARRAPKSKKQKISMNSIAASEHSIATDADSSSLRRSKRGHVPLKNTWSFRNKDPTPLFLLKYQEQMRRIQKQNNKNDTKKSHSGDYVALPIASSTVNSIKGSATKSRGRPKKVVAALLPPHGDPEINDCPSSVDLQSLPDIPEVPSEDAERSITSETRSHRNSNTSKNPQKLPSSEENSTQVVHINELFDQLRNGETQKDQPIQPESPRWASNTPLPPVRSEAGSKVRTIKKLRVCIKRTPMPNEKSCNGVPRERSSYNKATTLHNLHNISVQTDMSESLFKNNGSTQSSELLTWLKGVQDIQETTGSEKIFKEMHCYAADTLAFNDLEGVDYAFYDTDDKASLGYLRFKPHQTKPPKRTTKYNLHFVVLHGLFEIVTNGESGMFPAGDMIIIKTGSLYKIQNISNDVGILMVIKK